MTKIIIISVILLAVFIALVCLVVDLMIDMEDHDRWCKYAMHDYPSIVRSVSEFDDYVEAAKKRYNTEDGIYELAYYWIQEEWYDLNYK